jgi:hypothetical protein
MNKNALLARNRTAGSGVLKLSRDNNHKRNRHSPHFNLSPNNPHHNSGG